MNDNAKDQEVKQAEEHTASVENVTSENNAANTAGEVNVVKNADNTNGSPALDMLVKIGKKQLFLQRITTLATVGIFVVVLVAMIVLVPKVTMTLTNIDKMVADASSSVENINAMVAEMTEASKNLNQLVNDNTEPLTQAVNNMAGIDFEGLNKAITDLQATVGPMAQFFSRFR